MSIELPDPRSAPLLFENILKRRSAAYIIDFILILIFSTFLMIIVGISGILTAGLAWLTLPIILPLAILIYYASTLGSNSRSTIGMRIFDIVLVPTRGTPLDGYKVLIHPIVFWITIWAFAPLLFIALFTKRRQLAHDFITSTMMVRKSPLEMNDGFSNPSSYNNY